MSIALALGATLFGCDEVRVEPQSIPNFVPSYKIPEIQSRLSELPVRLNLDGCVGRAVLSWRTMTGGYDREPPFVFKTIVEREFRRALTDNFSDVTSSGSRALVELRVLPNRVNITGDSGKVSADMAFSIQLLNPTDETARPYFSRDYRQQTSCRDLDVKTVPACVYESVQRMVLRFVKDLAANRPQVEDLVKLLAEGALELTDFKIASTEDGEQCRGSVLVSCKDHAREQTLAWARGQIDRRCQATLRAQDGKFWVFYATSAYDEGARRWSLAFDAVLSGEFVVVRDSARRGRCYADFSDVDKDRKSAPRVMRRQLIEHFRVKEKRSVEIEIEDIQEDADNKGVLTARYRLLD